MAAESRESCSMLLPNASRPYILDESCVPMIAEQTMTAAVAEQNELDLESLNAMFETADPARIVDWAVAQFGPEHTLMSSSFGAESAMLLHMATTIAPEMKVIFVDTGYLFPETHLFMEQLRRRL